MKRWSVGWVNLITVIVTFSFLGYLGKDISREVMVTICVGVVTSFISFLGGYLVGKVAGEGILLSPYSMKSGKRFVIIDSAYSEKANQTYVKVMMGNSYRTLNIHGKISERAGYIRIGFEGTRYPQPRFEVVYKDVENS